MRSNVDPWNDREIVGWIADETDLNKPVAIEIVADGRVTRTVTADLLRQDLAEAGYGDGRHGFAVPDFKAAIPAGTKSVELRIAGGGPGATIGVKFLAPVSEFDADEALRLSQLRWRGDEHDAGLTWGELWTGDAFLDTALRVATIMPKAKIVEIGPGYGRILATLIERDVSFQRYLGVELSERRVARLNQRFGADRIEFRCGDVN